jgi:hypothetical protein
MLDNRLSEQIAFSTKLDAFAQSMLAAWAEDIRMSDKSAVQPLARMSRILPAFAIGKALIAGFQESGAPPANRRPISMKVGKFSCISVSNSPRWRHGFALFICHGNND